MKGVSNPIQSWLTQPKQSQSPTKHHGIIPRDTVIPKPDLAYTKEVMCNSNLNRGAYRSKIHVGRFGRVRIASNEPRAIRIPSSQSREKTSGRNVSMIEERGKSPHGNESQGNSLNTSYALNSSFQPNNQNNSFDFYIPSKPVVHNSVLKAYQSGEARSRRLRQSVVNPVSLYGGNPHLLMNKRA